VMFSQLYDTDAIRAVGVLKSMSMTVGEHGYLVQYQNPRACFKLDLIDTMHLTDTLIWAKLSAMDTFAVKVEKVNGTEAPAIIDSAHGLRPGWVGLDKYVQADFVADGANTTLEGALVRIYYTNTELDRTGDGDADEIQDVDETTLRLWSWSSAMGAWEPIPSEGGEINTTDQEVFGIQYAGYVCVNVTDLGWFTLAGMTKAVEVRVDVRSANGQSKISLASSGHVRVTIYGGPEAMVEWIDLGSLRIFEVGIKMLKKQGLDLTCRDVDRDGWSDLVVYFSVPELVECGALNARSEPLVLTGSLDAQHGSVPIRGFGAVSVPPGQI